jgi:hypothetical protein
MAAEASVSGAATQHGFRSAFRSGADEPEPKIEHEHDVALRAGIGSDHDVLLLSDVLPTGDQARTSAPARAPSSALILIKKNRNPPSNRNVG